MSASRDLTKGSISKALFSLAGPMMLGIVAIISVSIIDTYFVGKLGTSELTALSFTFPVAMAVTSIAIGLGAGASSVVSRAVGADNFDDAKRLTTDAFVLAMILVCAIAVLGFVFVKPLFALLGASDEVLDMIVRYMQIWFVALPFLVIPMVANAVLRAVGDAFWPSMIMVGSAFINMALTPLFIFGWGPIPAYNIEGAAYGTFVAQAFATIFVVFLVVSREHMLVWAIPPMEELVSSWKRVLSVGIPASFGNAVNPIGVTVVTAILAGYGDTTVAAFGVAGRIESLAAIPMLALSSAIGPVAGQSWGRGNIQRVIGALKQSYIACFLWSLLLAVVLWVFADPIVRVFSDETAVASEASMYLMIVPLTLWGYGCVIVAAGGYNSLGKSVSGLGFYLIRTALLYVPLSFAASLLADSTAVYFAIAITNVLAGLLCVFVSLSWLNKQL
jgi:putative MATE family efflux protein